MSADRIAALVAKLGATDAAARELIEIGEPALSRVDALVSDVTRPLHVRQAATLVAHHIRDRMLRAPSREPIDQSFGGDGFHQRHEVNAFVDTLYDAGAVRVTQQASTLLVELPSDPAARARLFAIYNAEVDALGEEFGGEETPGHEMTADDAAAMGVPEAAGSWVVDDFHAHDTGQSVLHFWWD